MASGHDLTGFGCLLNRSYWVFLTLGSRNIFSAQNMPKRRIVRLIIIPVLLILWLGCKEVEFLNPYDPDVSPEAWAPQSFAAVTTGFNSVKLTWTTKVKNFDGFLLVKSFAGDETEILLGKEIREYADAQVRQSGQPCGKVSYSLRARAGDLRSAVVTASPVEDFPVLTVAAAGNDIQGSTTTVTLDANVPNVLETASWQILSGEGGTLSSTSNPKSGFTGVAYRDYQLRWTISGICGTQSDEVIVSLRPLATIQTGNITVTGGSTATVDATVESDGGAPVTERGIAYGLQPGPTTASGKVTAGQGLGTFSTSLTGLSIGTRYYARAYAVNAGGTAYGTELSFTTWSAPTVSTSAITAIKGFSATSGGTVTADGQSSVTDRGVVWSTAQQPTTADNKLASGTGTGEFVSAISNLSPKTTYYVRAYAINSVGTAYGNQVSFTTTDPTPVLVSTNNCSSLTGFTTSYVYWTGSSYANAPWTVITNGYSGSCLQATNPNAGTALGGSVEFSYNFLNPGFVRFWINTPNPGYDNRVPDVYVDGVLQADPTLTDGKASSFFWMQLKTRDIAAGTHTIKLDWTRVGQFYYYSLDEIEYWEYR